MGRHTGDYLLGTISLAVVLISALSHGESESAQQPGERNGVSPKVQSGHRTTASGLLLQRSTTNVSPKPAYAVLKTLSRGTRIVIGSLDLSGARHAISVKIATDDSVPDSSLSVSHYSISDIRRQQHARHPFATTLNISQTSSHAYGPTCLSVSGVTPEHLRNVDLVCVHALSELQPRVFLTPHFSDAGTVHEATKCRHIGESSRVRVYLDQHLRQAENTKMYTAWSERLTSAAELHALPIVEAWIGPINDVDLDQKLSIVVTDLDQRTQSGSCRSPIHGCIREADFVSDSDFCGDVIYVDLSILELPTDELAALFTHEATHAAVCSLKTKGAACTSADTAECRCHPARHRIPSWLNEAVAHFMELQGGGNSSLKPWLQHENTSFDLGTSNGHDAVRIDAELLVPAGRISENFRRRIDDFLANPARSPIVAAEDVLTLEERRSGSRGAATLFLAPCFSSPEILQQFLRSQAGLNRRIEDLTDAPFADVFRKWTLSMATITCEGPTLSVNLLPAATNHERYALLGTAFLCFECSEEVASLVIISDDDAILQISVIEPETNNTTMAMAVTPKL